MIIHRPRVFVRALSAVLLLTVATACSLNVDVDDPAVIAKNGGDEQTVGVNTVLPTPFSVLITTQFGHLLPGVTVNWSIVSGGGSLSQSSSATNEGGIASVNYTTGGTTGTALITAQVHGIPPVTFTVHIT